MSARDASCVIVGGSAAGIATAVEARRGGYSGRLVVVDSDPHMPYERPPLSKALFGSADDPLVPLHAPEMYAELGISLRLGEFAVEIDASKRTVQLERGEVLPADRLVLATGLGARRLNVPGATASNVLTLRNAADARALGEHLQARGPLVIVGAGFIGLELAAVAREHGIDVTVVESADHPLVNSVGPVIAKFLLDMHRERGVQFVLGTTVSHMTGTQGVIQRIWLENGRALDAATVVVGVGAEPSLELARSAGIDTIASGIPVGPLGETNLPWIFAAGDVAVRDHPDLLVPGRIEHWDSSVRHGSAIGSTIAGHPTTVTEPIYAWSDQYGSTLQLVGRAHPKDTFILRDGASTDQFLGFWVRDGRIGAAVGLRSAREIAAVKRMITQKVTVPVKELCDRTGDLRRVLKNNRESSVVPMS
ncbi:pyridine nucleotide-disulfide oxidoreductase [Rhodococcus sp. KBS0724]|uniref:NAD(P)/FAD-dependent oxidoreductase n=1 Tax=Rhodococcus sp. KBS0724 TaxID=1179674 RepID=UPI00110D320A|nr:FAD-dependent oxidoreductase [Rhodococcus sp. KBS0724]TSD40379.1 pyridine nucleotide-disulfide oxidoreductase [Rhodococcus sp. KBS0724]